MRALGHGDLTVLARHLLTLPAPLWAGQAARLLSEAHAADRYFRRFRRAHPYWGNGALAARLGSLPRAPEPPLGQARYIEALLTALIAVLHWRAERGQPRPAALSLRSKSREGACHARPCPSRRDICRRCRLDPPAPRG